MFALGRPEPDRALELPDLLDQFLLARLGVGAPIHLGEAGYERGAPRKGSGYEIVAESISDTYLIKVCTWQTQQGT